MQGNISGSQRDRPGNASVIYSKEAQRTKNTVNQNRMFPLTGDREHLTHDPNNVSTNREELKPKKRETITSVFSTDTLWCQRRAEVQSVIQDIKITGNKTSACSN